MTPKAIATALRCILRDLAAIRRAHIAEAERIAARPFADSSFAVAIENALAPLDDDDDCILASKIVRGECLPVTLGFPR